jgi:hypothetical protein
MTTRVKVMVEVPNSDDEGVYREELWRELAKRHIMLIKNTEPAREVDGEILREKEREQGIGLPGLL